MRALFAGGAAAGPLFVTVALVAGATRAAYDPLRHPISSLALGPYGWVQTVNFLVTGLLTVGLAAGLLRRPGAVRKVGAVLVGGWGVGLLGAGAFVTYPVSGYPPGTPALPEQVDTVGALHDGFSVLAFFSLAAACFVLAAGGGWMWRVYSILSGAGFLAAFFVASLGFQQDEAIVDAAGLWQRVSVVIGLAWLTVLAVRSRPARTPAGS